MARPIDNLGLARDPREICVCLPYLSERALEPLSERATPVPARKFPFSRRPPSIPPIPHQRDSVAQEAFPHRRPPSRPPPPPCVVSLPPHSPLPVCLCVCVCSRPACLIARPRRSPAPRVRTHTDPGAQAALEKSERDGTVPESDGFVFIDHYNSGLWLIEKVALVRFHCP